MKKGFTLVELLAVIVILSITFMFILPRMSSLINKSESYLTQIEEEKIINAAKEYVSMHNEVLSNLKNSDDIYKLLKDGLINDKLVDEEEFKNLEKVDYIEVSITENDEIKYTIKYK